MLKTTFILYILSSHVEEHEKKFQICISCLNHWFPGLQILHNFLENWLWSKFQNHFQAEITPCSLLSLQFSNSLQYGVEESRELRALISWVLGLQTFKNAHQKNNCQQFFFFFWGGIFELPLGCIHVKSPNGCHQYPSDLFQVVYTCSLHWEEKV